MAITFFAAVSLLFSVLIEYALAQGNVPPENDPDIKRNVSQLIISKGFPVEEYEVTTADGYILGVQRIPYGRINGNKGLGAKKVVYIQHGLLGASSDFVMDFENSSLGFVLANAGYDVWLGNSRGNAYARKHINYNATDKKFWNFSFDEMAKYDLPTTLDFILKTTNQQKLSYVGHSQGTTLVFAMLSSLPEYNNKIIIAITLAPIVFENHNKGIIRLLAPFGSVLQSLLDFTGISNEFLVNDGLISRITSAICKARNEFICKNVIFLAAGPDSEQLNDTRLPVYSSHIPSGTSTKSLIHHAQYILSGQFQKYDYGFIGNLREYKQTTPPLYPLEKVSTPVAIFYGENDWLSDPEDVAILRSKLKNVVLYRQMSFPKWNHIDFVIGIYAPVLLYPDILRLLAAY